MKKLLFLFLACLISACNFPEYETGLARSCDCLENGDSLAGLRADYVKAGLERKGMQKVDSYEWLGTFTTRLNEASIETYCPMRKVVYKRNKRSEGFIPCDCAPDSAAKAACNKL